MQDEKCRTSGDGMEQQDMQEKVIKTQSAEKPYNTNPSLQKVLLSKEQQNKDQGIPTGTLNKTNQALPLPGLHTLYRRQESITKSLKPFVPKGDLILMKPRLVDANNTLPEHRKNKPPKFVPYEPYTGAVNPIMPKDIFDKTTAKSITKSGRNNLDIGVLVSQMSSMRTHELREMRSQEPKEITKESYQSTGSNTQECNEIKILKDELKKVKEERDYLQGQFKFQIQVNAELKNLLVASVGEDLQTQVNVLTEDKLQLARALLDTAKNLSTHTEQIEFLAGQCEVWRSKFLASSVMVEELARWKADLTQKNQMLTESTKRLLDTTHQLRQMQLDMLKNFKFLAKIRYLNLPAADVITLSAENLNILQQMVLHSGVGMPEGDINISVASTSPLCDSEKYAAEALAFISQPLMATDEAIKALFGHAQRPYISKLASASTTDSENSNVGLNNS